MPRISFIAVCLLSVPLVQAAAEPAADTARGDKMLEAYFRKQVKQIADGCLTDLKTKEDWEKKRPELRRQFLEMMGLWPLPQKTDLKPVATGKVETDLFTVEKLHFQSLPRLYVTANLYIPKKAKFPAPAVLYLCGHANKVVDGVSYGNKVSYQHHPSWFAENGYVCMAVDTLQLGEIEGIHHGTCKFNMWWWHTLGYTPAGIELWNSIRALDYLESRKEVDPKRLGVTGRSGGGASSWWLAAADDRPQCIIPVAGIADLQGHVCEGEAKHLKKGLLPGHCDCMYFTNTYRWDFPMVAALRAPKPLMLGNSDIDPIFPVASYRRIADKVRKVYDLYGAKEKFALLETKGEHKDTPTIRMGAFRWMNRWLKDDQTEIEDWDKQGFTPAELKVLDKAPADELNTKIQESFIAPALTPKLPEPDKTKEWWEMQSAEYRQALKDKVFRGWPAKPPELNVKQAADIKKNGLRLRAFDFISEDEVPLRVWLLTAEKVEKPTLLVLTTVDEDGYAEWIGELGPDFKDALQVQGEIKLDEKKQANLRTMLEKQQWAFATVAPRGIGPTRWSEAGNGTDVTVRRKFALLGQTLDGQRVWDVRRAFAALRTLPELKDVPPWLQGKGVMAGIALYAGLFEPDVVRLDLHHPPASHKDGPIFLNVRRVLDMPQAMALAFPRKVIVYVKDDEEAKRWDWPRGVQKALDKEYLKIRKVGN